MREYTRPNNSYIYIYIIFGHNKILTTQMIITLIIIKTQVNFWYRWWSNSRFFIRWQETLQIDLIETHHPNKGCF